MRELCGNGDCVIMKVKDGSRALGDQIFPNLNSEECALMGQNRSTILSVNVYIKTRLSVLLFLACETFIEC